jgi:hypothetical protein
VLIIFGVRRRATRLAVVMLLCPSCQTPAAQVIRRLRRWVTVFFVPLVPLGTNYDLTCTMCGATVSLSPRQAGRYVGSAGTQPAGQGQATSQQPRSSLGGATGALPPAPSSDTRPWA